MQTAFLEVVIPPDIIYEETSGDMMVPEGGSAKLVCKARGFPKPKITWKREDGREIIARNGPHGKTKGRLIMGSIQFSYIFMFYSSTSRRGDAVAHEDYQIRDGRIFVYR
jgi:hypothetical protein